MCEDIEEMQKSNHKPWKERKSDGNKKMDDALFVQTQLCFDKLMMTMVGGKERSEEEWAHLFYKAGFSDYKIFPILDLRSLIEIYP